MRPLARLIPLRISLFLALLSIDSSWPLEAPVRTPETPDRVRQVRERFEFASRDAANAKGCTSSDSRDEWWREPAVTPRKIDAENPLRVVIAGGGVAGLVAAAACHAKGMKVAIFEQAANYAPYGGPIQIQSNALRALERINPVIFEELVKAGTVTADRISGLKIGYKKGVFMNLGQQYERGDWYVVLMCRKQSRDSSSDALLFCPFLVLIIGWYGSIPCSQLLKLDFNLLSLWIDR